MPCLTVCVVLLLALSTSGGAGDAVVETSAWEECNQIGYISDGSDHYMRRAIAFLFWFADSNNDKQITFAEGKRFQKTTNPGLPMMFDDWLVRFVKCTDHC